MTARREATRVLRLTTGSDPTNENVTGRQEFVVAKSAFLLGLALGAADHDTGIEIGKEIAELAGSSPEETVAMMLAITGEAHRMAARIHKEKEDE